MTFVTTRRAKAGNGVGGRNRFSGIYFEPAQ